MSALWFALVSLMLAVYVVLDGFDFGAGIIHLFVAKTDEERQAVIGAIGPVWDGNEVWLLAGGGTLFFAFPKVYAAGFSGFYLPLVIALWLLILRGTSIEFRSHEKHWMWHSFWDGLFAFSSLMMAVILGAALGNVIRGVPLTPSGYFQGPLFTNFMVGQHPGVLDWYTVLVGVFTVVALGLHGACYLNLKTEGALQARIQQLIPKLWVVLIVVGIVVTYSTNVVRTDLYQQLIARPWTWILAAVVLISIISLYMNAKRDKEMATFLSSTGLLVGLLAATAAGLYPVLLASTLNSASNLTAANSSSSHAGLVTGVLWWSIAMVLAAIYFVFLFRSFKGKVHLGDSVYGH